MGSATVELEVHARSERTKLILDDPRFGLVLNGVALDDDTGHCIASALATGQPVTVELPTATTFRDGDVPFKFTIVLGSTAEP